MTVFAFHHPWPIIIGLMAVAIACLVTSIVSNRRERTRGKIVERESRDDPLAPLPGDDVRAAIAGDFAAQVGLFEAACDVNIDPCDYADQTGVLQQVDWEGLRQAILAAGVAAPNDEDFARLEREHSAAVFRPRKGRSRET